MSADGARTHAREGVLAAFLLAAFLLAAWAAGCAATNAVPVTPETTITVPLGGSATPGAPPAEEPVAGPEDVRCAGDVPEIARPESASAVEVEAARHRAKTTWRLSPTVNTPTAFFEQVAACGAEVDATDAGKRSFEVRFATSGVALWVRPIHPASTSAPPFAGCLARAACLLQEGRSERARTREASFETTVEAPVFVGKVAAGVLPTFDPRTGKSTPLTMPAADAERTRRLAEQAALGCAFARPPAETFSFEVLFTFGGGTVPRVATLAASPKPYLAYIARCFEEGMRARLPKAPGRKGVSSTLRLSLRVMYQRDVPGQL